MVELGKLGEFNAFESANLLSYLFESLFLHRDTILRYLSHPLQFSIEVVFHSHDYVLSLAPMLQVNDHTILAKGFHASDAKVAEILIVPFTNLHFRLWAAYYLEVSNANDLLLEQRFPAVGAALLLFEPRNEAGFAG